MVPAILLHRPGHLHPLHHRSTRAQVRFSVRPSAIAQPHAARVSVRAAASAADSALRNATTSQDGTKTQKTFYVTETGEKIEILAFDYGFRSGYGRMYTADDGTIPLGSWNLAWGNFTAELEALRRTFRHDEWAQFSDEAPSTRTLTQLWRRFSSTVFIKPFAALDRWLENVGALPELTEAPIEQRLHRPGPDSALGNELRQKLKSLQLSPKKIDEREKRRIKLTGGVKNTPWYVQVPYQVLCFLLDVVYPNRPIQRFWLLETVARMPYFSYISMLHLYETLGWWRAGVELRKIHYSEEENEAVHLQIMESLGGDRLWIDRFIGQHAAILYYWVLIALFAWSPAVAYNFSELLESHAVDTYGEFADANKDLLKSMPPPLAALEYYKGYDMYSFDKFQTGRKTLPRRPPCRNLYEVFVNIRDDEGEHVRTMHACQYNELNLEAVSHLHIASSIENGEAVGTSEAAANEI